jgi:DNA helicase II / ATP-dependent DNA helicase PcrA
VDTISYKDYLRGDYTEAEYEAKIENINELINVLSTYDGMEPRVALEQFIDEVSLLSELDGVNDNADYVTLMTIHTAKGLERENVFIAGLEDGILPHIRTVSNPSELEEERRLMYVAMTRAKEKLFITTARERYQFGEYIRNPISRFIKEIPDECIEELETVSEVNYFSNSFSGMFGNTENSPYTEPRSIVP